MESLGFVMNLENSQAIDTRLHHQFSVDDIQTLQGKKWGDIAEVCPLRTIWELAHLVGNLTATQLVVTPAPQSSSIEDQRASPLLLMWIKISFGDTEPDRSGMVNHLKDHTGSSIRLPHPEMINRLVGMLEQPEYHRSVVTQWIPAPHECQGASSNIPVSSDFYQKNIAGTRLFKNRQPNSSVLPQQDGWYPFQGSWWNLQHKYGNGAYTQESSDFSSSQAEHTHSRPGVIETGLSRCGV